jgi:hypothetical protein
MTFKNKCLFAAILLITTGSSVLKAQSGPVKTTETSNLILNASELICLLKPITSNGNSTTHYGIAIESVKQNIPAVLRTDYVWIAKGKNNEHPVATQNVDMLQLIPLMVAALKEQQAEIAELKKQLKAVGSKTSR